MLKKRSRPFKAGSARPFIQVMSNAPSYTPPNATRACWNRGGIAVTVCPAVPAQPAEPAYAVCYIREDAPKADEYMVIMGVRVRRAHPAQGLR